MRVKRHHGPGRRCAPVRTVIAHLTPLHIPRIWCMEPSLCKMNSLEAWLAMPCPITLHSVVGCASCAPFHAPACTCAASCYTSVPLHVALQCSAMPPRFGGMLCKRCAPQQAICCLPPHLWCAALDNLCCCKAALLVKHASCCACHTALEQALGHRDQHRAPGAMQPVVSFWMVALQLIHCHFDAREGESVLASPWSCVAGEEGWLDLVLAVARSCRYSFGRCAVSCVVSPRSKQALCRGALAAWHSELQRAWDHSSGLSLSSACQHHHCTK